MRTRRYSDGEELFDWVEHFDDEKGVPFWWSASRGERKDEEPVDPHVYAKEFVGERVRANWPGDREWCVLAHVCATCHVAWPWVVGCRGWVGRCG